jgi:membrane-associated phospholipid phosphatase
MPRRARRAFTGAALGVVLMIVTWYLAHEVAFVRHVDASILSGFLSLRRPGLDRITHAVASLCDPVPYVVLAAIPVVIALLRGRPRVAIAIAALILGATETTEVLKPLLAGPRDPVPGVSLLHASWPSGHATAAMALALAMVISVPARLRSVVAAGMAAFTVAVVYSFLELGWHYPSDVLGGFEVASTWALVAVGTLWTFEARRPQPVRRATARFSLVQALAPPLALIACGLGFAALLALAHPHVVLGYAAAHTLFVVGAAAIAALSFACASGLNLMLRVRA